MEVDMDHHSLVVVITLAALEVLVAAARARQLVQVPQNNQAPIPVLLALVDGVAEAALALLVVISILVKVAMVVMENLSLNLQDPMLNL
jgi:hypothetical protein